MGVALYVVGFAETVADLIIVSVLIQVLPLQSLELHFDTYYHVYMSYDLSQECETCSFTGSRINDIRVIGIMIVLVLFLVALIGLDWEAKVSQLLSLSLSLLSL